MNPIERKGYRIKNKQINIEFRDYTLKTQTNV